MFASGVLCGYTPTDALVTHARCMNLSSHPIQHPAHPDNSDNSDNSDVRVLHCKSTADFLAALPQLVGFTATNSLFVVFFSGKQSGNAIRVDLPDSEDDLTVKDFITGLMSVLQDIDGSLGASSPAIVITSAQRFAELGRAPWRGLARSLKRRLERNGVRLRELCCLAPDAWVSYLDVSAPPLGRPLDEIAASPIASATVPSPDIQSLGEFIEGDQSRVTAVQTALAGPVQRSAAECAAALIGIIEPSDEIVAGLIHASNTEEGCIQIFDQLFATASALHGRVSHELPSSSKAHPGAADHNSAVRDASRRLRLASERLTAIAPLTPTGLRPAVIAVCALAWWLRGIQSVSHRQIAVALELEPTHETANIVQRIIDSEHFPMRSSR